MCAGRKDFKCCGGAVSLKYTTVRVSSFILFAGQTRFLFIGDINRSLWSKWRSKYSLFFFVLMNLSKRVGCSNNTTFQGVASVTARSLRKVHNVGQVVRQHNQAIKGTPFPLLGFCA